MEQKINKTFDVEFTCKIEKVSLRDEMREMRVKP